MFAGLIASLWLIAVNPNGEISGSNSTKFRTHSALRVSNAPRIDGDLSDEIWRQAKPITDFVQQFPKPGTKPTYATQIRVVYDQDALFIAVQCHDPNPEEIVARLTRRDRWIESDWFLVELDSRRDLRSGHFFVVNAAGVKVDGILFDENQENSEWDGVWDAQSRIVDDGWNAEIRIPLHLLRYPTGDRIQFGANFSRHISRLNELDQWQYISAESNLRVSRFGILGDLNLMKQKSHIELSPYLAYRLVLLNEQVDNRPTDTFDIGLDAKVGLGSNLMLTMTANPDFGQVELDQVVLNLTTMEKYLPEKRPFFLADRALFMMPTTEVESQTELFYSRRIGQPQAQPLFAGDQKIIEQAPNPRIYGAAKVAGVTQGRLSIGLIQAVTSEEQALVENADGSRSLATAEPLTSYSVMRLEQAFSQNSAIGMMATAAASPDAGAAITGGTNLQWELFDGSYNLTFLTHFSYLTEERFLRQDSFTRYALRHEGAFGYGGNATIRKKSGEYFVAAVGGEWRSPSLALNDVGYLDRADVASTFAWLQFHHLKPIGPIASFDVSTRAWLFRNTSGLNLNDGIKITGNLTFLNKFEVGGILGMDAAACDDRETQTQGRIAACKDKPEFWSGWWIVSDESKMLSARLEFFWGQTYQGDAYRALLPIQFNPASHLQFELSTQYFVSKGKIRYLDTIQTESKENYVFGNLHWEQWDITFRSTLNFDTQLSLQAYTQVFLATVDYRQKFSWKQTAPNNRIVFSSLAPDPSVSDDYDFTTSNLNIGMVLRWEYQPGSVAYLVYTGRFGYRSGIPEFRFGNVFSDLLTQSSDHVLMLKLTYFWA